MLINHPIPNSLKSSKPIAMADYKIPQEIDELELQEFYEDDGFPPPDCFNINFVPGLGDTVWEDEHYFICRALYDFLETHPEFDKMATYKVFKLVHMGRKHGKHFNFEYKDRSYHAYVDDSICQTEDGVFSLVGYHINRLSVLEYFY